MSEEKPKRILIEKKETGWSIDINLPAVTLQDRAYAVSALLTAAKSVGDSLREQAEYVQLGIEAGASLSEEVDVPESVNHAAVLKKLGRIVNIDGVE